MVSNVSWLTSITQASRTLETPGTPRTPGTTGTPRTPGTTTPN